MDMPENTMTVSQDSEFGTKPITPLFVKYAGLALIGLLSQGIMVLLEGILIGNGLGTDGFTMVGILMPLEYFQLALHGCFGIGISTLAAIKLGDGKTEEARKYFAQGMWLAIYLILAIVIIIEVFASRVAAMLGCPAELHNEAVLCIRVFVVWWPFSMTGQIAGYMVRVDEKPKIGSFVMTLAAVAAVIWAYSSIFLFHVPMAVSLGVYYGSSIGLFVLMFFYFLFNEKTMFKMRAADMKPDWAIIGAEFKIGFPYLFTQISASVFGIIVNNLFLSSGNESGIAVYAVLNGYTFYMLMMIMQAATQGMQPIASYNLGAGKIDRVSAILKAGTIGNLIAVYAVALVFIVFAQPIYKLLCGGDMALVEEIIKYNFMICAVMGLGLTADFLSGYFQSVEKIVTSTVLAISRYIIFSIPLMFLLSKIMGDAGVWYGQAAGYILAFVLSMFFIIRELKRLKNMYPKGIV